MQQHSVDVYQYKSLPFNSSALSEDQLNQMGAQGWFLVSTLPNIIFAKRIAGSPVVTRVDDPLLLSIKQVADRLNMSRSKVYGLIAAGTIASVKVGRLTRVPRQELEIFVRTMRKG
ncbi:MAG: helix-turn-helix domain-containing protein [Armatimonadota bacterium]